MGWQCHPDSWRWHPGRGGSFISCAILACKRFTIFSASFHCFDRWSMYFFQCSVNCILREHEWSSFEGDQCFLYILFEHHKEPPNSVRFAEPFGIDSQWNIRAQIWDIPPKWQFDSQLYSPTNLRHLKLAQSGSKLWRLSKIHHYQGWFQGPPIMGPPDGKLPIPFPYL